jgi:uncharacterized protein YndB with AHSA1/START domain
MRRQCEASVNVVASPEAIWAVISDVTRVGEWSGECRGCSWVDGSESVTSGAHFRGRNRRGGFRWTRLNEVTRVDPPRMLAWRTLPRAPYVDSVEWRVSLAQHGTATSVTESFEVLKMPRLMEWLIGLLFPPHRDRTADLKDDLERLKYVVESGDNGPPM